MPDLRKAIQDLKTSLGDHAAGNRPDGVFYVQVGGPGSVPALADLDVPEIHLDLMPGELTPEQRDTLTELGYVAEGKDWLHPGGWRLVLPDHDTGWRAQQHTLAEYLLAHANAAQHYRELFQTQGRNAADEALRPAALEHHANTVGFSPARFAANLLQRLDVPWMFAAGVALDLHLGRVTRPHDDLDIIMPRDEAAQHALQAVLNDWDAKAAVNGAYAAWEAPLSPPHFQVHARHPDLPNVIMLDFMLSDLSGGLWHYRRDPSITLPLGEARRATPDGLPYLAPQAALLFKASTSSGQIRPKDEQDFRRSLPTLGAKEREWLADALAKMNATHPWLASIREPNAGRVV